MLPATGASAPGTPCPATGAPTDLPRCACARRDRAQRRVEPAPQCFGAFHQAAAQVHLRLVVELTPLPAAGEPAQRPGGKRRSTGALVPPDVGRGRGVHMRIAVNLSARLLQDTAFPARLRQLLEASGVAASALELEITEGAMMLDPARALRVIQDIDQLGVLISIDDFGTGYSSLGYLRDLPVHSLKLDKSFVMGMHNNTDDRIIVESTAQMAHALRLELVAEGVETDWDAQFLAAAGYDFAQGYRYARAMPADKCLAWVIDFNATAMIDEDYASRTA